ncbi:Ppx/GppA phosphatase family protein [Marinoscillum sp. MHG1-6]|uniref:Ppx/GppA phosphatase family protein n=1 Tax=Marinoscillum sp. MHG1-6 TaxID=2959627 RepID=UPI0021577E2F|nr:Ppx/GppA phosphatase family protein [Marinoscillum sp. MHG1-6]
MRIAVIDMGTNTFHLLIVDVKDEEWKIVYREKAAVKIGKNGINQGRITPEAEQRALDTLNGFKAIIDAENVYRVFATATSAIRNASNGQDIVKRILEETGIAVRVISGLEEAEHIYYGVKKAMPLGSRTSLIMDIGGGSIEFIIGNENEILWKQSFEVGGQRLVEKFHKTDPITDQDIADLKSYLEIKLDELFTAYSKYQPTTLIGSSGTFDTLSDIYCIAEGIDRDLEMTEYPLTITAFHKILQDLKVKNREDRLKIPGMIPLRVDMIVVACLLIEFVIEKLQINHIRVSAYALKEGVLLNTLRNLEKENTLN